MTSLKATNAVILTTKAGIRPESKADFVNWQAKFHHAIAAFQGFSSLEISSSSEGGDSWVIVQRFQDRASTTAWQTSNQRKLLLDELRSYLPTMQPERFQDIEGSAEGFQNGITEVFVTQVSPENEEAYRKWIAKIHQTEANFPGFQRAYVQAPIKGSGNSWITFLQFDKQENLDRWLASAERENVLKEAKPLIESLESHRVISPYAGWFAKVTTPGERPSVWKQTMLILLVLFPIVMVELKYLSLLTKGLNFSLATFISNAISVSLISWPMMPIALYFLGWWVREKRFSYTLLGVAIICFLYLIEIAVFWNFM